jgi:TnpA family transposase
MGTALEAGLRTFHSASRAKVVTWLAKFFKGAFYTHLSDQFTPFHAKAVNVGVRDATYVLDGLLYHESDLRIEEHYTDTAGFTDHVFALMHLLGFRFAPRLRDLGETGLYVPKHNPAYTALKPMIGGVLQIRSIRAHWDEILRWQPRSSREQSPLH